MMKKLLIIALCGILGSATAIPTFPKELELDKTILKDIRRNFTNMDSHQFNADYVKCYLGEVHPPFKSTSVYIDKSRKVCCIEYMGEKVRKLKKFSKYKKIDSFQNEFFEIAVYKINENLYAQIIKTRRKLGAFPSLAPVLRYTSPKNLKILQELIKDAKGQEKVYKKIANQMRTLQKKNPKGFKEKLQDFKKKLSNWIKRLGTSCKRAK